MKKQILFLTFFVVAILAGFSSYGQLGDGAPVDYTTDMFLTGAPNCASVTPISCTGDIDELHPQAGKEYTYDITAPAGSFVQWFVIANDNNVMASLNNIDDNMGTNADDKGAGAEPYILSSTNYNTESTTTSTTITWKAFDGLTQQVLLVAYVEDADRCTDNVEIYRILPVINFTLDVNAIASAGTEVGIAQSVTAEECVSPIESAIYTPSPTPLTVPGVLEADYGENWVFFTVTAANFTHSWQPTFTITYSGVSAALEADWAYSADAQANTAWNSITTDGSAPSGIVNHTLTSATAVGADDGTGECIVVRVRVDHGVVPENAVDAQNIRMAVNGFMYNQTDDNYTTPLNEDLHYADLDGDTKCNDTDGILNDYVDYVLTPRPQIINATAAPSIFETKADNSDDQGNN